MAHTVLLYKAIYTGLFALHTDTTRRPRGRRVSPDSRIMAMTSIDARPAEAG